MSSSKYADLPDIDTAPDIYETDDVISTFQPTKDDDSEDDVHFPQRNLGKTRIDTLAKEDIDSGSLLDPAVAGQIFRKANTKSNRLLEYYGYPPSPSLIEEYPNKRSLPLSQRLIDLQQELVDLETELADPSNPRLAKEREVDNVDPGELIRELVDVRKRVDRIRKTREGRAKLVGVLAAGDDGIGFHDTQGLREYEKVSEQRRDKDSKLFGKPPTTLLEMDRRLGALEALVGSSSVALDETSPLPHPLIPLISKLNGQLALFTQPRHIDSITRRLKLLASDMERAATPHSHRRHPSQPGTLSQSSQSHEQFVPLLSRLAHSLPHIPHMLTRLRTLAGLHTSASEFQEAIQGLESRQQQACDVLNEIEAAVKMVQTSLEENNKLVRGNVTSLESRIDWLLTKLEVQSLEENV